MCRSAGVRRPSPQNRPRIIQIPPNHSKTVKYHGSATVNVPGFRDMSRYPAFVLMRVMRG
jgi:hypothetical protein